MAELNLFSTSSMSTIVKKATVRYNFLQILLGLDKAQNQRQSVSDTISAKVRAGKGNKSTKPVGASAEGRQNAASNFDTLSFTAPRFREYTPLTASWANGIIPANASDEREWKKIIASNIQSEQEDLIGLISNTWEVAIGQILQTGKVSLPTAEGGTFDLDLKPSAENFENLSADPAYKWNGGTKTLPEFFADKERVLTKKGYKGDLVILGSQTAAVFAKDANIKSQLNILNIDAGALKLQGQEVGGYTYLGKYLGKEVYEYSATHNDGVEKSFIDPTSVIITSKSGLWNLHFAAIKDFKAIDGTMVQKFFSKAWDDEKSGNRNILVESDSIPVCLDVDAIYCAKVLV